MTSLEADMIVLGEITRWQPSEIMAMSIIRRQLLTSVIADRASGSKRPIDDNMTPITKNIINYKPHKNKRR